VILLSHVCGQESTLPVGSSDRPESFQPQAPRALSSLRMDADDVEEEVAPITPRARSGTYTVDKKVLFCWEGVTQEKNRIPKKRRPHFPRVNSQQAEALSVPASQRNSPAAEFDHGACV